MSFSRRNFIKQVAGGAYLAVSGATGCAARHKKRPNVIFLTADTTRFDRMGFNGYRRNKTTPFLDTVAARGVNFTECHAQATCTFPSVASFMTSKHPHTLGIHQNLTIKDHIKANTTVLAETLRTLGYTTVGATSVLWLGHRNGMDKGFDYFSFESEKDTCQRDSEATLASAKAMLRQVPGNTPLFLWFHSFDPHIPYDHENVFGPGPPDAWAQPGERQILLDTLPEGVEALTEGLVFLHKYKGFGTKETIAKLNQLYDSQIAHMDAVFEKLLVFLKREGLYDPERDLIVCNADHGELMGEHGFCSLHGKLWHEITHVPLILAGGGLPRGKSVNQLVGNLDIVPTILEIVAPEEANALEKGLALEGSSMLPAVFREFPTRQRVLTDFPHFSALGSFDGRYKVIARHPVKASANSPEKRDPWALSGVVHFDDSQGIFRFEIPETIFRNREVLTFEFMWRSIHFAKTKTLSGRLTGPVFDLVTFHTRDGWDSCLVPWGTREWKLVLKDAGGKIVYDSETEYGWVRFQPMPSPNYDLEVYDLKHDPGEATNVAREFPEELLQEWLEDMLDEFENNTGTPFKNLVLEKARLKNFSDDELEDIKDLGYL
jgi:arylsulfatase A-like enzyme